MRAQGEDAGVELWGHPWSTGVAPGTHSCVWCPEARWGSVPGPNKLKGPMENPEAWGWTGGGGNSRGHLGTPQEPSWPRAWQPHCTLGRSPGAPLKPLTTGRQAIHCAAVSMSLNNMRWPGPVSQHFQAPTG